MIGAKEYRGEVPILPEITLGHCEGKPRDPSEEHFMFQELGNKYCRTCWDNGRGGALTSHQQASQEQHKKRKTKKKKEKEVIIV